VKLLSRKNSGSASLRTRRLTAASAGTTMSLWSPAWREQHAHWTRALFLRVGNVTTSSKIWERISGGSTEKRGLCLCGRAGGVGGSGGAGIGVSAPGRLSKTSALATAVGRGESGGSLQLE